MFNRGSIIAFLFPLLLAFTPTTLLAHHMAPDEMQDFITEQLIEVDSAHLLSSDDDPSLLDMAVDGIEDLDYVVVSEGLSADEVTSTLESILEQLSRENEVCDVKYVIEYDAESQTFTLTVYVDFCSQ